MKPGREIPQKGELWRHFKGGVYQIVSIATHSETKETLVIYAPVDMAFCAYARPLAMFMSKVDRAKYPVVGQTYRFEKIQDTGQEVNSIQPQTVADAIQKLEAALKLACGETSSPPHGGCRNCIHGALAEEGARNMGYPSRWQCTLPKERQVDFPMGELHCVPGTIAYFKRKAGIEVGEPEC